MSTISDSQKKSKTPISHSEFKIQNKYNTLKIELDSKLEKEGYNNIKEVLEDINRVENQLKTKKIDQETRSIKEKKLNNLNQLLNLYNDCFEIEQFNEGMKEFGFATKNELLLEIDLVQVRLGAYRNEKIKEVNEIKITKLNSLKTLIDKIEKNQIEEPKIEDDKVKEEQSKMFSEEKSN